MNSNSVLIIDDEPMIRRLLSRIIELEGYAVFQAGDCASAVKQTKEHDPDVVLCDVFLPDGNGVELIKQLKELRPDAEIILLTAHGNIADGVQAIKNGAFDYITKGDDNNKILPILSRAMDTVRERKEQKAAASPAAYSFDKIIGESPAIKRTITIAEKVAVTDVSVLLSGETGTGKEVFAQAIHEASPRHGRAFVAINCSAFSRDLLESELFGHKAGAFTGALRDKHGLFAEADHGTIFLDEIGEMAYDLQAKLLRVLETGEYLRIGDTKPTKTDVRVISATNRDLRDEIAHNTFREDLFYRLSVFHIELPPLRERRDDIPLLAKSFIKQFSAKLNKHVDGMTPECAKVLRNAPWKGNVRELRNVIERGLIVCDNCLRTEDLPIEMQSAVTGDEQPSTLDLATVEKHHIAKVLQYTGGNKSEAARLLKIGLTTLYRKIDEYNLK